MKLIELSEVEILIMKSIWKLGDGITVYEIIDYLDQVYDRKYTRSTVKTYITKLKKKGFVDTQVKGNYSYITAKITEEMYREEQMELMKDFWHDGSVKELVQTLTHTISKEEKEAIKAEIKAGLEKTNDVAAASAVGTAIAKKALDKGITEVVFDRGGFIYQGKIKALAEAAREAGLQF